jgi:quercetin dioxygenase-like cupin family protein
VVRGPSVSGTFRGVTEQKIEAGDLIIAPVGVPHVTGKTTEAPRDILRIALDPDKVLPLK